MRLLPLSALEPSISRSVYGNMLAEGQVRLVEGEEFTVLDIKAYKVQAGPLEAHQIID
jgi:hypothetical protein